MFDDLTAVDAGLRSRERFGRYLVVEPLGKGGWGRVDLAVQEIGESLHRVVALKRLNADRARVEDGDVFLDEVRITSRIDHPFVARVLDAGVVDGVMFYAMDVVLGVDLGQLSRHALLAEGELATRWQSVARRIISDACEALHAAHQLEDVAGRPLGVVHRDVSPSNLLVGFDGAVRVIDFGIATASDRLVETWTGGVKGKPGYVAPERLLGRPTDARADVWGLAVVLWECLARRRLFGGRPTEANDATIKGRVPALDPALGVPTALEETLRAALSVNPDYRPESARAFGIALRATDSDATDLPDVAEWIAAVLPGAERRMRRLYQHALSIQRSLASDEVSSPESPPSEPPSVVSPPADPPAPESPPAEAREAPSPEKRSTEAPTLVVPPPRASGAHLPLGLAIGFVFGLLVALALKLVAG